MSFPIFTVILGIVAGLVQFSGYVYYIKKINVGRVKPNTASWSIWAFGAILDTTSYIFVTGDWVKNILPVACALSAIVIFFYCLYYAHFGRPIRFEWSLVALDFVAVLIWWYYSSAIYANLFLVSTEVISFIPIIRHTWKDPMVEDALPWFVWTAAYSLLAIVVLLRWEKWEDLAYPAVFAVLHVIIAVLALDKRVPRTLRFAG
jgi:hypothetical protein